MLNIFLGFEQANRYAISACRVRYTRWKFLSVPSSEPGRPAPRFVCATWVVVFACDLIWALSIVEQGGNALLKSLTRQLLRTHRPFNALIMDTRGYPLLWVSLSRYPWLSP